MGSFDMNASFSKMPLLDEATLVICLKRSYLGETYYMPLTYPVKGHYYDYGQLHNFEENEITKAICDFFEIPDLQEITELIYDMTIRGDYEDSLLNLKEGKDIYRRDRFEKYLGVLDKLRENSGLKVLTQKEIYKGVGERLQRYLGKENEGKLREVWIERETMRNHNIKDMLDSYELSLFYENTPLFEALCGMPDVDRDTGVPELIYPGEGNENPPSLRGFSDCCPDSANLFIITGECTSPETIGVMRKLRQLNSNFRTESKKFIFTEPTILGQDSCPYMWYQYGKAVHQMWKDNLNEWGEYKNFD